MNNIMLNKNLDYCKGYYDALIELNTPMLVIQEKYSPSQCPKCKTFYDDYEECDDGYYSRAISLSRCPYCGQAIYWYADEKIPAVDKDLIGQMIKMNFKESVIEW